MTRALASLAALTMGLSSSLTFAGNKEAFDHSMKIWAEFRKDPNLAYSYTTEHESWVGLGTSTRISVKDEKVTERSYELWRWYYDYEDNSKYKREIVDSWKEDTFSIGSHEQGDPPRSLDQIYDFCQREILNFDSNEYTIEFTVDEQGLIKTCRARSIYCADDCWDGINIIKFEIDTRKELSTKADRSQN